MLFILFQLGADHYALPAGAVAEVLPLVSVKELPGAPRGVAGLMNYRGKPVPVVDLGLLATGQPAARRVSTRLLMVRVGLRGATERLLALLVERATETLVKAPEEFQPAGVRGERSRFTGPVTPDARGLIQRVDVAALLDDELQAALFASEPEVGS